MTNINESAPTSNKSSVVSQTADQIRDRASDATDALKDLGAKASSTVGDINDKAAGLLGTAKDMASDAGDKVADALEDKKAAGAERAKGISDAIRRAADELEQEIPPAATYIRRAADEIDSMADAVQRRDIRQLVGDIQSFARRQPAAFLGATVLAGFAVMRLLKAPTAETDPSSRPSSTSAKRTSLIPVGPIPALDEEVISGGLGDPGGISPVAPGFESTSKSAGAPKGSGPKASRS